jgi:hypothetical protein
MIISRFPLGELFYTSGVESSGIPDEVISAAFNRHLVGDFGDLDEHDCSMNERAIRHGSQVLSSYQHEGIKFWIITDPDRTRTTVLLPSEY